MAVNLPAGVNAGIHVEDVLETVQVDVHRFADALIGKADKTIRALISFCLVVATRYQNPVMDVKLEISKF